MFYKQLSTDKEGNLVSWGIWGEYSITYQVGKWMTAHPYAAVQGYYLCVFDDINYVKNLLGVTYSCVCDEEVRLPQRCNLYTLSRESIFIPDGKSWPPGTRMFRKIMLIEQVFPMRDFIIGLA